MLQLILCALQAMSSYGTWRRSQWAAKPARSRSRLAHPAHFVVLTYNSGVDPCYHYPQCEIRLRDMQQYYQKTRRIDDIPYNFLVGDDPETYEARGWHFKSDKSLPYPELRDHKLDFAFIGDYTEKDPPTRTLEELARILDVGMHFGYLAADYRLLLVRDRPGGPLPGFQNSKQKPWDDQYDWLEYLPKKIKPGYIQCI